MNTPYYKDEYVTLYCGDSLQILPTLNDEMFDCVITDPPYTEHVHSNYRGIRTDGQTDIGIDEFDFFTDEKMRTVFDQLGRVTNSWVISTMADDHAFLFKQNPPLGMKFMRMGVWVKLNPNPQITGDRPAHGWEAIAYMHKDKRRAKWNGGGVHGNYVSNRPKPTGHPTPKSNAMFEDLVCKFTNKGDTILDPFAGGGTTLIAAKNMQRKSVGIELEEKYCELIANKLSQGTFDFDF
jgi:site-specific DNA-methyltransferase (adenine-specific)